MPLLSPFGLRAAQVTAINALEQSLGQGRRRSLIQMATGAGKTYMACSAIYRLIKFAGARRVLFLVDRGNLGRQTLKEFQAFRTPDDGVNVDFDFYTIRTIVRTFRDRLFTDIFPGRTEVPNLHTSRYEKAASRAGPVPPGDGQDRAPEESQNEGKTAIADWDRGLKQYGGYELSY
jgi:hypothetical protein